MIEKAIRVLVTALAMIVMPFNATAEFAEKQKLLASDGGYQDAFGRSVSISGETIVVGQYQSSQVAGYNPDAGSAYVFTRDPATGVWTEQQKLLNPNNFFPVDDFFASSVSISGDIIVIGAYGTYRDGGDGGAAYVYNRDSTTGVWTLQQELAPSDGLGGDRFGRSVYISGETIVVGADGSDDSAQDAGSAYVFIRDPATGAWFEQQKLIASDGAYRDNFGRSVSISDDTILVGAHRDDDFAENSGSAYVFVRDSGTGFWREQQKLVRADGLSTEYFGWSVSISGDTAAISAVNGKRSFYGVYFEYGLVYMFGREANTGLWILVQTLTGSDSDVLDRFGQSVSIEGDTVVVGAVSHGDNSSGSAYVFVRDKDTGRWNEQQELISSDGLSHDRFGESVAISARNIVVGAYGKDHFATDQGSAYVFESTTPAPIHQIQDIIIDFGAIGLWARIADSYWLKLSTSFHKYDDI